MATFIGVNGIDNTIAPGGPLKPPNVFSVPPASSPGATDDIIFGGDGNDILTGGAGNDVISGGAGNDTIRGNQDNDTLFGGDGNDTISGGLGNNILTGGPGADMLNSVVGAADVFVLTNLSDSLVDTFDTINIFKSGEDKIAIGATGLPLNPALFSTFSTPGSNDLMADLTGILPAASLLANGAAEVTITSGTDMGSYVVINDAVGGYSSTTDAVVKLENASAPLKNTDFIT
jgi:hemolysin type calcium-binding protein